ncbi:hypothetical protein C5167_020216 [Papaver somniferum]|uniref:Transmembrane protein n=1 Tax=Papaver somniferum TaxID=3469 RepID=A0A4Y7IWA6_PAPSO|nr:uncharacterized protein LOC113352299 [Papaver somniferum]RZC51789.1 hypothetical protein C5167_020216 [Papaver somniferum]
MASTSITTLYTGFFFVLLVIFVTEMAFGHQKLEPESIPLNKGKLQIKGDGKERLKANEQVNAVDNNVKEDRKGKMKVNPANVGLRGRTTGSNNIGHGLVKQRNSLRGSGSLKRTTGRIRGKQEVNVGNGLATAKVNLRPRWNLKKGNLKVTGGGLVGVGRGRAGKKVGAKKGLNLQRKKTHTT